MENVVQVKVKNVYGVEKIYPANEAGALFAKLCGSITLTPHAIEVIKELGYKIEMAPQDRKF